MDSLTLLIQDFKKWKITSPWPETQYRCCVEICKKAKELSYYSFPSTYLNTVFYKTVPQTRLEEYMSIVTNKVLLFLNYSLTCPYINNIVLTLTTSGSRKRISNTIYLDFYLDRLRAKINAAGINPDRFFSEVWLSVLFNPLVKIKRIKNEILPVREVPILTDVNKNLIYHQITLEERKSRIF